MHAVAAQFTTRELIVTLADGRKIVTPLEWYPRLQRASAAARANYEIMPMGSAGQISMKTSESPAC